MATRTIKLRLVMENAQALRAAQQFNSTMSQGASNIGRQATLTQRIWGQWQGLFAGYAGVMGVRMLAREFASLVRGITPLTKRRQRTCRIKLGDCGRPGEPLRRNRFESSATCILA